jgi:importin-5
VVVRLSWLPVWEDVDEAPHIYGFLCDLMEANNQALLGQENANVPRIIAVMAEAFSRDALEASSEVAQRMVRLLRLVQMQADGKMFEACVAQLGAEQQQALLQFMSAAATTN